MRYTLMLIPGFFHCPIVVKGITTWVVQGTTLYCSLNFLGVYTHYFKIKGHKIFTLLYINFLTEKIIEVTNTD